MATPDLSSSGEEVRSKPATQQPPTDPPADTESADATDYYDILVLGRTGTGKSSTVDKLMVSNSRTSPKRDTDIKPHGSQPAQPAIDKLSKTGKKESEFDEHRVNTQSGNLCAWVLSDKEKDHETAIIRIKNIVFCRELENSHLEVDELRGRKDLKKTVYSSSTGHQLLMNEDSNIRALDTPGFFSPSLYAGAANTEDDSNLAMVRKIIYMQTTAGLRFNVILYYLPGVLNRDDTVILKEIRWLVKFFDRSIFSSTVLVATVPDQFSRMPNLTAEDKCPKIKLEESQDCFYDTMKKVYEERGEDTANLPKPPIIFIAMTDTCTEILEKVMSAPVTVNSGLKLEFQQSTCPRCSAEIGTREKEEMVCTYRYGNNKTTVAHEESLCHPAILPAITVKSFFRGLAELFRLKWHFNEECCINPDCKKGPGSPGCKKINSVFETKKGSITINHTNRLDTLDT